MSIFSSIKKSHSKAKEHNAKLAQQHAKESDTAPYKHVPTHAALDALSSAPPAWREAADRPKIAEQNRRRSVMAASGHHMNIPGIPRVGSALSYMSYPSGEDGDGRAKLPRAYSYGGTSPYGREGRRRSEGRYSVPDLSSVPRGSWGGLQYAQGSAGEDSSPGEQSGDSSSQDELEIKPSHRASRRISAPEGTYHGRSSSSHRNSRPPVATRGFNAIPESALTPPVPLGAVPGALSPVAVAGDDQNLPPLSQNPVFRTSNAASRQSSTTSLPGLTPVGTKHSAASPSPLPELHQEYFLPTEDDMEITPSAAKYSSRRASKTARFSELERIDSITDRQREASPSQPAPAQQESKTPVVQEVINVLPEPASDIQDYMQPGTKKSKSKSKGMKLLGKSGGSSGGSKLSKKNRWSTASSNAVAV